MATDAVGEVVQDSAGQRDRGRVNSTGEAPGRGIGSWSTAVLPEASSSSISRPTRLP